MTKKLKMMMSRDGVWMPKKDWQDRFNSLRNVPPIFRMVWESAPKIVASSLFCRLLAALLPVGMLVVTRRIIDAIYIVTSRHTPLSHGFWGLVALQFGMACMVIILARLVDFCDTALNERYTRHVNTRIMRHAATLDLSSFEDPQFYDRLERARVQGADRVGMIQESGVLVQQVITTITLAVGICAISPWILLALIVCVVPEFLCETKFAFLGYSLSVGQTPRRRELDYLRILGTSKETAKEQKLFGLGPFFADRYASISNDIHHENVELAGRKLIFGSASGAASGAVGYYHGAYAYGIYLTITGILTLGTLTFLAGAIAGASTNIQAVFATFSHIADHALFLTDLIEFFRVRPTIYSKPRTRLRSGPVADIA